MKVSRSTRFEILRRLLAAVADQLVLDHLTFVERGQAGALDRGDMDKYVFAAVLRLNESIAFRRVEPFHGASSHLGLLVCTNLIATARPSCDRPSEVSAAYGKAHREVRDKTRPRWGLYAVLARGSTVPCDRRQSRTPLDNPTNKVQPQPSSTIIRNNTGAGGRETGRAPACNHRSVTGQPYSAWRWPRPSASAWQPLLWHTANIWHG